MSYKTYRKDLSYSFSETALLPLPAETRRVVLTSPDGAQEFTCTFNGVVPDGSFDPAGGLISTWLTGANGDWNIVNGVGVLWRAIPEPRGYLIDGEFCLGFQGSDFGSGTSPSIRNSEPMSGSYLVLRQRQGVTWDNAAPVLERMVYGNFMMRELPSYGGNEEILIQMINRLRAAILNIRGDSSGLTGGGPTSAALIEVEAPDRRRERYSGISAMIRQLHSLENRLNWLRATDGGRVPLAGFRIGT